MTYTPNGKPRNAADEIANARAYAAEEAKHPAIRAQMVEDAQGPGAGVWIAFALIATAIIVGGAALWLLFIRAALVWFEVLP